MFFSRSDLISNSAEAPLQARWAKKSKRKKKPKREDRSEEQKVSFGPSGPSGGALFSLCFEAISTATCRLLFYEKMGTIQCLEKDQEVRLSRVSAVFFSRTRNKQ